mmetsp:Transcript_78729/g.197786  ORF Transcript_78729/g.197786 Transcript_78729/m.197786 type:complete len:473 (-) Transcript_78729:426-1844(-)
MLGNDVDQVLSTARVAGRDEERCKLQPLWGLPLLGRPPYPRPALVVPVRHELKDRVLVLARRDRVLMLVELENLDELVPQLQTLLGFEQTPEAPHARVTEESTVCILAEDRVFLHGAFQRGSQDVQDHTDRDRVVTLHDFPDVPHVPVEEVHCSPSVRRRLLQPLIEQRPQDVRLRLPIRVELGPPQQPALRDGLPAQVARGDVDDARARHGGRRGVAEVLNFEDNLAVVCHRDAVVVGKGQDLVVVQDRVEVLNPNRVDRAVTDDPSGLLDVAVVPLLPDRREHARRPLLGDRILHAVHLRVRDGLRVHDRAMVRLTVVGHARGQDLRDLRLAAQCWPDKHEAVPHEGGLVELDDLQHPGVPIDQVALLDERPRPVLDILVDLLWRIRDFGEDVLEQREEKRHVVCNELGQVHVADGAHEKHLLVRIGGLGALHGAARPQDGQDVAQTEVVVPLLTELLLAQCVQDAELLA